LRDYGCRLVPAVMVPECERQGNQKKWCGQSDPWMPIRLLTQTWLTQTFSKCCPDLLQNTTASACSLATLSVPAFVDPTFLHAAIFYSKVFALTVFDWNNFCLPIRCFVLFCRASFCNLTCMAPLLSRIGDWSNSANFGMKGARKIGHSSEPRVIWHWRGAMLAKIRQNGLGMDLALTERDQVIGYRLVFVQADLAGVGADETFVEDATRKLIEVLIFNGAEHAKTDFRGGRDSLERNAAQFALRAKIVPERTQGELRRAFLRIRPVLRWHLS
jgi:hypothetical protein